MYSSAIVNFALWDCGWYSCWQLASYIVNNMASCNRVGWIFCGSKTTIKAVAKGGKYKFIILTWTEGITVFYRPFEWNNLTPSSHKKTKKCGHRRLIWSSFPCTVHYTISTCIIIQCYREPDYCKLYWILLKYFFD